MKVVLPVALAVATLLSGVAIFVPTIRDWFAGNPWWGWAASLALLVFLSMSVTAWRASEKDLAVEKAELAKLSSQAGPLRKEVETLREDLDSATVQARSLRRDLAAENAANAVLRDQVRKPSVRDVRQFEEILDSLSWGQGLVGWLSAGDVKRWDRKHSDRLFQLVENWREWFFDCEAVEESFRDLYEATDLLAGWMAQHGGPTTLRVPEDDPSVGHGLLSASEAYGGYEEFSRIRAEGQALVSALLERRRAFEQVGRANRL